MKLLRFTVSSVLLILFLPFAVHAEVHSLAAVSRIESVTVFADRAQVTRSASFPLQPGTSLVSLEGLPVLMMEDSLRAEGSGAGRARIAGITTKTVFLEQLQEKRIRELEQELRDLERKLQSIEARRKALAAQRAFIDSIRVGWSERISKELSLGKPTTAELGEAAKFVGDGIAKIEEGIYDAQAAEKPLADRIAALKKELEQAKGNRRKEARSVEVAIEAERAMPFSLKLSYVVGQARWEPVYDVRLAADGASAELTYRAQVWQRTGEDWPGVKLALSSAAPEAGGAPPELVPWHISFYEPPRPVPMLRSYGAAKMALGAAPAPAPAMEEMADGAAEAQVEAAAPLTAEIAQGQTSVLFNVALPADIPADGTRSSSVIATEKLPVTAEYLTVPKLSPRVYLKSELVNATSYPLLAGQVNIFNDTTFTGKSRLKTVASGEKFDLFFGADDRLKVKREVDKVKKMGGLLSSSRLSYACRVELSSFKKRPVTVTLLDQLPLSGNAEIKVNLEDAQPRPEETRQDGTLVWKVNLAPGEKKKVVYDIVIEYPKGRELSGVE